MKTISMKSMKDIRGGAVAALNGHLDVGLLEDDIVNFAHNTYDGTMIYGPSINWTVTYWTKKK